MDSTEDTVIPKPKRRAAALGVAGLDQKLAATRASLPTIEGEIDGVEAQLLSRPDDAKLLEKRSSLQTEIDALKAQIESLLRAKRGLQKANSKESRAAEMKARQDARARVGESGKRFSELVLDIESRLVSVAPLLRELEVLGRNRVNDSWLCFAAGGEESEKKYGHSFTALLGPIARGEHVAGYLAAAVWRSGLGRVGISIPNWFLSVPRIEPETPTTDLLASKEAQLLRTLDDVQAREDNKAKQAAA